MYQAIMSVLTEGANLNESYSVHVNDGSGYGDKPHKADVDHVRKGVKDHSGEFDYHSDKGAAFKFKSRSDAESFARHVNKSPKGTCYADDVQESVEMPELTEQQIDELSKKLLGSYVTKASVDLYKRGSAAVTHMNHSNDYQHSASSSGSGWEYEQAKKHKQQSLDTQNKALDRHRGIKLAVKKLSEDDQVDESAQALANKQAELKKLKAQKASGSPLGNVDRDISNARAAIKKLKAQRASGWPLGEDEEPEDLSIEESVERILNEGFTYPGSRSILPASQALHDKAKSSIADIVDTWGHDKMTVQVAQKENGKHVYIAGHGHDKHDTEAFHAHHDQTFRNMGAHKVVNTIHLEGGKIVHKENDIGTDKAHPLYVYK